MARGGSGRCGLPEVALGVLPGTGGTQRLARVLGKARAIEMMAGGELVDFEKGAELGVQHRLGKAILDIIAQHHGDAAKPDTPEAGLVMVANAVDQRRGPATTPQAPTRGLGTGPATSTPTDAPRSGAVISGTVVSDRHTPNGPDASGPPLLPG